MANDGDTFLVEKVTGVRVNADGTESFRVRWRGFPPSADSWESASNLIDCNPLIDEFIKKSVAMSSSSNSNKKQQFVVKSEDTGKGAKGGCVAATLGDGDIQIANAGEDTEVGALQQSDVMVNGRGRKGGGRGRGADSTRGRKSQTPVVPDDRLVKEEPLELVDRKRRRAFTGPVLSAALKTMISANEHTGVGMLQQNEVTIRGRGTPRRGRIARGARTPRGGRGRGAAGSRAALASNLFQPCDSQPKSEMQTMQSSAEPVVRKRSRALTGPAEMASKKTKKSHKKKVSITVAIYREVDKNRESPEPLAKRRRRALTDNSAKSPEKKLELESECPAMFGSPPRRRSARIAAMVTKPSYARYFENEATTPPVFEDVTHPKEAMRLHKTLTMSGKCPVVMATMNGVKAVGLQRGFIYVTHLASNRSHNRLRISLEEGETRKKLLLAFQVLAMGEFEGKDSVEL